MTQRTCGKRSGAGFAHGMLLMILAALSGTVMLMPARLARPSASQQQPQIYIEWVQIPMDFPSVSRWEGAFDPATVGGNSPVLQPMFPSNNDSRFRFRIIYDLQGAQSPFNPTRRDEITADLIVYGFPPPAGGALDQINNIPLTETMPDSHIFELGRLNPLYWGPAIEETTRPFILVSNNVDDAAPPSDATYDRTLQGRGGQFLSVEHANERLTADIPLTEWVDFNPHIMRPCEPYVDWGFVLGSSTFGAQDYRFSWYDQDNDQMHDSSEQREPFTDRQNAGNVGAWDVDDPVVTTTQFLSASIQMNTTWAQARISFVRLGDGTYDTREPPGSEPWTDANANWTWDPGEVFLPSNDTNGNGRWDRAVDLMDGSMQIDGYIMPSDEERTLIESLGDGDPSTVDVFVVNALSNQAWGVSYLASWPITPVPPAPVFPANQRNTIIVSQVGLTNPFTCSHEMGHILRDLDHVMGDTTNLMRPGGTSTTDTIEASKRFPMAQITEMRQSAAYAELAY